MDEEARFHIFLICIVHKLGLHTREKNGHGQGRSWKARRIAAQWNASAQAREACAVLIPSAADLASVAI